jgi:hypothetical protein
MDSSGRNRRVRRTGPIALVVIGAIGLVLPGHDDCRLGGQRTCHEPVDDDNRHGGDTSGACGGGPATSQYNARFGPGRRAATQNAVATIGVNAKADSVILRALGSLVGEISSRAWIALQALEQVRSTVATIDGILQGLDRLPLVTLPDWVQDVSAAIDELGRVGQQIQETVTALDALRTGAIDKAVTSVTEKATALESRLANVQTRTQAAEATVSNLLTTLQNWESRLPGVIDLISALLTLFLLLMAVGQWALLSLGWSSLKVGAWVPFYPLNRARRTA